MSFKSTVKMREVAAGTLWQFIPSLPFGLLWFISTPLNKTKNLSRLENCSSQWSKGCPPPRFQTWRQPSFPTAISSHLAHRGMLPLSLTFSPFVIGWDRQVASCDAQQMGVEEGSRTGCYLSTILNMWGFKHNSNHDLRSSFYWLGS